MTSEVQVQNDTSSSKVANPAKGGKLMPRQKYHRNRVYQEVGEPGSIGVGYVRYSSDLQNETSMVTQKRLVKELFEEKGWKLGRWYEEPERSANNDIDDLIEERPVFAHLLMDATANQFRVVVCAFSNRWARSMEVGYASLTRLRRARIWWCTADGLWDIDKVQQDGFNVAFAVDMSMNEAYVRQLSKRTIAGKEDRAREGYHNGSVSFGYLPPRYPKPPDNATSTWRPPRIVCAACRRPLRVTFGNVDKNFLPYYRDTSVERKLPCTVAEAGFYSVRSSLVVLQFGDILRSIELPLT